MDHEDKVGGQSPPRKIDAFFEGSLVPSGDKRQLYSLPEEFAKTRRNKNILFYLSLVFFLAILVLATMEISNRIQKGRREVAIDIKDMENLRLSELLSTAKKHENELRLARSDLQGLRQSMNQEVIRVKDRISAEKEILATRDIGQEERQKRMDTLRRSEQQQVAAIRARYQGRIREKQKEIERLQEIINKQDKKLSKSATVVDNYQRLQQLELNKVRKHYEDRIIQLELKRKRDLRELKRNHKRLLNSLVLKYNPVFADQELQRILGSADSRESEDSVSLRQYSQILFREGILDMGTYTALNLHVQRRQKLLERLRRIEYTNSVYPALKKIDGYTRAVVNSYDRLWGELVASLAAYRSAVQLYTAVTREHGYVIGKTKNNEYRVLLNRTYTIEDGDQGFVIRGEKRKIATVSFHKKLGAVRARVVQMVSTNSIQPFDKVLIQLKKE